LFIVTTVNKKNNLFFFRNKFPPERLGPMELDMSQFTKIFSTSRLPGETKDILMVPDPTAIAKYIVVIHNNHVSVKHTYL
jgi:hypothetical protein